MPVNLKAVAEAAGVSVATASRVLGSGPDSLRISAETRRRVIAAALQLGYRPHRIAQSLKQGKTFVIGLIVPRLETRTIAEFVNGVEQICAHHDYQLLIGYSHHDALLEESRVELLLEHRVDGLLVYLSACGGCEYRKWMERVREEHIHLVVIRERPANPDVNYVTSDFEGGAREAVTHLVRLGHRRIGHISGHRDATSAMLRLSGYRQALIAGGIEPDEALVRGGRLSEESAAQAMRELIELSEPPTAVFVANDLMAVAAMEVIRDHGLRVPADIAVVGFGNWYWSEAIGLTTVDENPHEMGQQAGKRLFELLENPDLPPKKIVVPTQLVVRASCGARRDFVPLVTAADVP